VRAHSVACLDSRADRHTRDPHLQHVTSHGIHAACLPNCFNFNELKECAPMPVAEFGKVEELGPKTRQSRRPHEGGGNSLTTWRTTCGGASMSMAAVIVMSLLQGFEAG
jgi:hypothetical protein